MEFTISGQVVLVDGHDAHLLIEKRWRVWRGGNGSYTYVIRTKSMPRGDSGKRKTEIVLFHREVLGLVKGDKTVVDHINGNGLDNRRENLRICTHAENMRNRKIHSNNSCGFKGVVCDVRNGRWRSRIRYEGHIYNLGSFDTPMAAHDAYIKKAKQLHGEFMRAR